MKKFLFKTTALVSALTVVAGSAVAGGHGSYGGDSKGKSNLDITIGGYADFQAGFANEDIDFKDYVEGRDDEGENYDGIHQKDAGEKNKNGHQFRTDVELHFNIDGVADNGLKYGAAIELEAGLNDDDDTGGTNADIAYLYVDSSAGKFEMGDVDGASTRLKVDAGTIARATGGIDGKFYQYITQNVGDARFLDAPDIGMIAVDGETETAGKISYYSPVFSGLQFGASFVPDSDTRGNKKGFSLYDDDSTLEKPQYGNVFELGLNYSEKFDSVGVMFSATAQRGSVQQTKEGVLEKDDNDEYYEKLEDLKAYAVGLGVSFEGLSVVGSYGATDDLVKGEGADSSSKYYTAGIAYETGPFAASVTYLASTTENGKDQDDEFQNISVGADYKLAPGFLPYIEASFFEYDQDNSNVDNKGSVIIVGSKLKF